MLSFCFREITYYRYKNVDLYLRGVRDFLKGPRWLMRKDAEALNKELIQAGYQAQDLDKLDMGFNYPAYEASREDYGQAKIKAGRDHRDMCAGGDKGCRRAAFRHQEGRRAGGAGGASQRGNTDPAY